MDQYKFYDPSPPRRFVWLVVTLVQCHIQISVSCVCDVKHHVCLLTLISEGREQKTLRLQLQEREASNINGLQSFIWRG